MNKIVIISIFSISMMITSCKKDFLDVNTDPSKVTSTDAKLLVSSAIVNLAYNKGGETSKFASLFSNQLIGIDRQSLAYSNYIFSSADFDNLWKYSYFSNSLKNDVDLINFAKTQNKPHYQALGNILLAIGLTECSDLWGSIPYTEAFQGLNNISPKFDDQSSIYTSSDNLLTEAITLLNGSDNKFPLSSTYDLIYGGSAAQWIKLAYSVKARNYIHLSKQDISYNQKAIDAAMMGLASAADNALVTFGTASNNSNPWFQYNDNRGDIIVHDYFAALIASDPRQPFLVDGDGYVGSYYGSTTSPVDIFTYEELKFILAEAKTNLGQSATTDFQDAVNANITRITGSSNATYVTSVTSDESLSNIMTQKYIAMFTSHQAWTDWRRTGFPALVPNTGSSIPRSFLYPNVEIKANSNCPANSNLFRKVWWDI